MFARLGQRNFHRAHGAHLAKVPTAVHRCGGLGLFRDLYRRSGMDFPFANLRHVLRNSDEPVGIDSEKIRIDEMVRNHGGVHGGGAGGNKNLLSKSS